MRIKDIAAQVKPGQRIKIAFANEDFGWSDSLTDAQIIAYWERIVVNSTEFGNAYHCVIV